VTLLAVFVAYIGLLYVLGKGLSLAFRRLGARPSVEAVTRVLLGVVAAVVFIFIMRGVEALSLP
jgi:hypothetical protein